MIAGVVLTETVQDWAVTAFATLFPGGHAAVFGGIPQSLEARRVGFEVRDSVVILIPGGSKTVWLFRRPLEESTIVDQLQKTGTGGLWIDGCRVRYLSEADKRLETRGVHEGKAYKHAAGTSFKKQVNKVAAVNTLGRFPSNLLLVHAPICHQEGTLSIKGHPGYPKGPGGKSMQYSSSKRGSEVRNKPWAGHSDPEGRETIPNWTCEAGCPVYELDGQSGIRTSGKVLAHYKRNNSTQKSEGFTRGGTDGTPLVGYGDAGGASRFYPQFKSQDEVIEWLKRLLLGPQGE